jgi:formate hydrogenlyase subunit 3/multisubunit Na+/H+ antiporter MnhD subunit
MKIKALIFRILAIVFGAGVGFYFGLFIIAQVIRVILSSFLGWRDSGPAWGNWMIYAVTGITMLTGIYFSLREVNRYLSKQSG